MEKAAKAQLLAELMDELRRDRKQFGSRLLAARKRVPGRLSQDDVARALKVTPQSVSQWERGTTEPEYENLAALVDVVDFGVAGSTVDPPPLFAPAPRDRGVNDFPIYASAEGGPGEIIRDSDPVDWKPRPAPLLHVRDGYGMWVTGDSMAPEYRRGDTALVNPRAPHLNGEVHIFYCDNHQGEIRAMIKELRRAAADRWHVLQHNPPKEFTLSRKEWSRADRVIGKYRNF